ncbi:MAG: aspartate/glutamate racemase family protein [Acholeplasmataceae bacterium]
MKTIGLLGGMSWESTMIYYQQLNQSVKEKLGGTHSAKILLYSFDYHELETLLNQGHWEVIYDQLYERAVQLISQGAELIVLCANTMHILAEHLRANISVPLVHIVEATAAEISLKKLKKVLLIGTKFTMQSSIYQDTCQQFGIDIITPNAKDQDMIHQTIYLELIQGIYSKESLDKFIAMIERFKDDGIEGVIMGCTEIPLLLKGANVGIELFDTLSIHVAAIIEMVFQKT